MIAPDESTRLAVLARIEAARRESDRRWAQSQVIEALVRGLESL